MLLSAAISFGHCAVHQLLQSLYDCFVTRPFFNLLHPYCSIVATTMLVAFVKMLLSGLIGTWPYK